MQLAMEGMEIGDSILVEYEHPTHPDSHSVERLRLWKGSTPRKIRTAGKRLGFKATTRVGDDSIRVWRVS